jgi:hypothetical protein
MTLRTLQIDDQLFQYVLRPTASRSGFKGRFKCFSWGRSRTLRLVHDAAPPLSQQRTNIGFPVNRRGASSAPHASGCDAASRRTTSRCGVKHLKRAGRREP